MAGYSVKRSISDPIKFENETSLPPLYRTCSVVHKSTLDNQKQQVVIQKFSQRAVVSENNEMPVWLYGLIESSNTAKNNSLPNTAPDLDLKLAAPRSNNLEQNKTSQQSPLFVGPISVT